MTNFTFAIFVKDSTRGGFNYDGCTSMQGETFDEAKDNLMIRPNFRDWAVSDCVRADFHLDYSKNTPDAELFLV